MLAVQQILMLQSTTYRNTHKRSPLDAITMETNAKQPSEWNLRCKWGVGSERKQEASRIIKPVTTDTRVLTAESQRGDMAQEILCQIRTAC